MSVKALQEEFKKFGKLFKLMWINPGAMRWVSKGLPSKYFSSVDVFRAKANRANVNYRDDQKRFRRAKAKVVVVGALTLPVGLPVALVALPVMFFYKGVPFLRTQHLNKVSKSLETKFGFCKVCARQCGKILTAIGHPKLELICKSCTKKIEGWAEEAGELVRSKLVPEASIDEINEVIEDHSEHEDQDELTSFNDRA